MNGWPVPSRLAICQDAAKYPELWDRLRGFWVPSLFPSANVADLSASNAGTNCSISANRFPAVRTSGQTGEVFRGMSGGYLTIPGLTQTSGTRPAAPGWTLVMKLRRFNNTTAVDGETAIGHFGTVSGSDHHYPYTDGNLYIGFLSASRFTISPGSFDKTRWHDLTVTSQQNVAGSWNCYQNGGAISTGQNPGDWWFSDSIASLIGAGTAPATRRFNGLIRHVLLYNRILDLGTIQRLNADPTYAPHVGVERRAYSFGTVAAGGDAVPVCWAQYRRRRAG